MEPRTRVRRDDKIAIMFSSDMRRRVNLLAEGFGMPSSTLCAFAVATWVQQQENTLALTRQAINGMAEKAGEALDAALIADMGNAVVKRVIRSQDKQGLLPLDDETEQPRTATVSSAAPQAAVPSPDAP